MPISLLILKLSNSTVVARGGPVEAIRPGQDYHRYMLRRTCCNQRKLGRVTSLELVRSTRLPVADRARPHQKLGLVRVSVCFIRCRGEGKFCWHRSGGFHSTVVARGMFCSWNWPAYTEPSLFFSLCPRGIHPLVMKSHDYGSTVRNRFQSKGHPWRI